ncbi:MAG: hypothetical protein P9M14_06835 [Candidatus Alcyoniella australis]|nr:hypothetical protein [Candidatus Alcyoniella australis]
MRRPVIVLACLLLLPLILGARPLPDAGGVEFWAFETGDKTVALIGCRVPGKGLLESQDCSALIKPGSVVKLHLPDFIWRDFRIERLVEHEQSSGNSFFSGTYVGEARPAGNFKVLQPHNPTYEKIALEWARNQGGVADTVKITRLLRLDLDSDGTDEVLLAFDGPQFDYFSETPQQFSAILLRKIVGPGVQQIALVQRFRAAIQRGDLMYRFELLNLIDVDGDGVLDPLISLNYYEGRSLYFLPVAGPNEGKRVCGFFEGA